MRPWYLSCIRTRGDRRAGAPGRLTAALALSLAALVGITGCHQHGPRAGSGSGSRPGSGHAARPVLRFAGDGLPFGDAISSAPAGQKFSFGGLVVCLTRPGQVRVDAVTARDAIGGLQVTDFALRPNPVLRHRVGLRDSRRPLDATGFRGDHIASLRCSRRTQRGEELGLEVSKSSEGNARSTGWVLHYRWHGKPKRLTIPMRLVLCADPDVEAKGCALEL